MSLTACAQRNHDALFPGHASTLKVTDPELVEVFDDWAFDFLHATNDVLRAKGVELPLPGQATTDASTRSPSGLEAQRRILGDRIDEMHAKAPADEAHVQRFLTANCFGDHVCRGGLDVPDRELVTFSMLAAMGGCEPQLAGHVAANFAVGNGRAVLLAVLTQLLPFIGYPRTLNALRVLDEGAPPRSSK